MYFYRGLARGKKPLSAVLERAAEYADAVDGANSDSSSNSRSSSTSDEPDFGPQNKKPQRKGGRVRIQESQSAVRRHLRDRQRRRRRERPLPLLPLQWMHVCLSLQRLDLTPAAASKSVRSAPSGRTGAGVDIDREREGTGLDLENGQENVNGTASSEGTLDDVYVTRRRSSLDPERVQPVDTEKGNWALVASLAERQQSADKNGEGGDEMDMRLTRLAQQSSMRDLDGGTSKKGKSKKKNESTVFE